MRWWVLAAMLAACGGRTDSDSDAPVEQGDPWADDLLLGPISDIGEYRVTAIRWFGWGAPDEPLVVVELREDLRPLGQSVVRLRAEPEVLLDSASLQADLGQTALLAPSADTSGGIGMDSSSGCWLWLQDGTVDLRCPGDTSAAFRGPHLNGAQPGLLARQDRRAFELGVWDGEWTPYVSDWEEVIAVLEWAITPDRTLWLITADARDRVDLYELAPDGERTRHVRLQELPIYAQASVGSARFRGLQLNPADDKAYLVVSGKRGEMLPGTGIFTVGSDGLEERLDLTAPIVDDQQLAFLGTGAEPAFTWGFTTDGRIVFTGELADGRTGIYAEDASGAFVERVRTGDAVIDRFGEPVAGQTWSRISTGILGDDGAVAFTARVKGAEQAEELGVWLSLPDGRTFELARTGMDLPDSTEKVERLTLHGGEVPYPDESLTDPLKRQGAPVAGAVSEQSLVSWGGAGWNRSIRTEGGCTSVLLLLEGEEDQALVQRRVGDGC